MRLETFTELNLVEIDCELDFYNIIFSDVHEVIVPLMETVGARAG